MSRTKTTWEDLSNLGWPKQQVYNTLNAQRGGTMQGFGDIALNTGFATDYAWYCYNDYTGPPRPMTPAYSESDTDKVVWQYRNDTDEPFSDQWTESWQNTERVDASVSTQSTISINASVTVGSFFNTGFSFEFQSNSSTSQFKENVYNLSHTWTITVPPKTTRRLVRKKISTFGTQQHRVPYGLASGGDKIGTKGNKWNGHYYWAYSANYYLNNPSGTMVISSNLTQVDYQFHLEDIQKDGRTIEIPIEVPHSKTVAAATGQEQLILYAEPGPAGSNEKEEERLGLESA